MQKHTKTLRLFLTAILMLITLALTTPLQASPLPLPDISHPSCTTLRTYPDPVCTPGSILPDVTLATLCTPGYTKTVRNVSYATKLAVYHSYGIFYHHTGQYEIDHFIPLELGGSNATSNLWPEPLTFPGYTQKDIVENYLHQQVCRRSISLTQAQATIRKNWYAVYQA